MMISKTEYLNSVVGKKIDTDGVPASQPYQCADLIKDYLKKCYGIDFSFTLASRNPNGYARSLYENFDYYSALRYKAKRIENTETFVPEKGDIVVWGGAVGTAGHVAIATGNGNAKKFVSLDQNWSKKYYVAETTHNYNGVYGVIRMRLKITTANLNVRAGAGKSYKLCYSLDKGTLVTVYEYNKAGDWARIGEDKWVSAKYLD